MEGVTLILEEVFQEFGVFLRNLNETYLGSHWFPALESRFLTTEKVFEKTNPREGLERIFIHLSK